jgi:hypothetical protein
LPPPRDGAPAEYQSHRPASRSIPAAAGPTRRSSRREDRRTRAPKFVHLWSR